jgi:hypothetical protein
MLQGMTLLLTALDDAAKPTCLGQFELSKGLTK